LQSDSCAKIFFTWFFGTTSKSQRVGVSISNKLQFDTGVWLYEKFGSIELALAAFCHGSCCLRSFFCPVFSEDSRCLRTQIAGVDQNLVIGFWKKRNNRQSEWFKGTQRVPVRAQLASSESVRGLSFKLYMGGLVERKSV
jgi:hypothetical protein